MTDTAWSQPHHDGSATYVPEPNPKLGGRVTVFLRIPRTSDVTSAWVRVINDGEPELCEQLSIGRTSATRGCALNCRWSTRL